MMQHLRRRSSESSIESEDAFVKDEALPKSTRDDESVVDDERLDNDTEMLRNGGSMDQGYGNANGTDGSMSAQDEKEKWRKIYALHFLFMWNTRTYEFASVSCNTF